MDTLAPQPLLLLALALSAYHAERQRLETDLRECQDHRDWLLEQRATKQRREAEKEAA